MIQGASGCQLLKIWEQLQFMKQWPETAEWLQIMQDQLHINFEASHNILWRFRKEEDMHKVYSTQSHRFAHSATIVKCSMANCHVVEISHSPYIWTCTSQFFYSLNWKMHCIHPTSYLGVQHNFWSPIPPCCYIFCEKTCVIMIGICNPC